MCVFVHYTHTHITDETRGKNRSRPSYTVDSPVSLERTLSAGETKTKMERPRAFSRSKGTGLMGLNPELFMMMKMVVVVVVVMVVVVVVMMMMMTTTITTIYRVRQKHLTVFEIK